MDGREAQPVADKKVVDVAAEYGAARSNPSSDADVARLRKTHAPKVGKLEHDVDAVLLTKGLQLDEPVRPKAPKLGH